MADLKDVLASASLDAEPVKLIIHDKRTGEPFVGPDGEPCWIEVLGSDAPKVKQARKRIRKAAQHKMFAGGQADNEWALTQELAAAVVGWGGWESEGKPLECSRENVLVFLEIEDIRNQVFNGVYKHALFFDSEPELLSDTPDGGRGSGSRTKKASQPEST